ncbi:hypothetical protein BDA96_10G302500 [Sorghum bicolor]|uniref:Uncharacterized protein n=1 Tax=Sorghum bicolor TaxID=4558 RepID=A0A921Q5P3_SORBI|nr:hypothetical protein BDA96_10G302500 [Sorghum bicolor]
MFKFIDSLVLWIVSQSCVVFPSFDFDFIIVCCVWRMMIWFCRPSLRIRISGLVLIDMLSYLTPLSIYVLCS